MTDSSYDTSVRGLDRQHWASSKFAPSALVNIFISPGPYAQSIFMPTAFRRAFNIPIQLTLCPGDCDPEEHQYPEPTLNACAAAKAGEPFKLSVEYVLDALAASKDAYCNATEAWTHKHNAMQNANNMSTHTKYQKI